MTMDRSPRADRVTARLFEELADSRTPDYLEAAIERASSRPQRPSWTFPERWLPMADIASRPAFAPRLPWRTIAVALLLIALLIAGTVAFIGSRQTKLPPPFGVAGNGVMAYGAGGDIFTFDPESGQATAVVAGPETDRLPFFSRDGTRFAFFRLIGTGPTYQLMVANVDGSGSRVVSTDPVTFDMSINWSADGRSLILDDIHGHLTRLDTVGSAPPVKTTYQGVADIIALRPPDEGQLLYRTVTADGWSLSMMDVDGTHAHPVLPNAVSLHDDDYVGYSWSPDGSKIAFRMHPDSSDESRIFIVNADGTGLRRLTHESGIECECDMFWSPDGTQIAFNRWRLDSTSGDWHSRPVALASVADGTVRDIGPFPSNDNGIEFAFSPDGTSITWIPRASSVMTAQPSQPLVIDIASGTSRAANVTVDTSPDWQRLAR